MLKAFVSVVRKTQSGVNSVWKSAAFGWFSIAVFAVLWFYWMREIPTPGRAVAVLAVGAALMSVRPDASGLEKSAWIIALFGFLSIELKAIDKDRIENEVTQASARLEERTNFREILDLDKTQFLATLKTMGDAQSSERNQFRNVFLKQQQLFDHEEKLAESTSGVLAPGSASTPQNSCTQRYRGAFYIFYGNSTFAVRSFPHVVLASGDGPLITLNKDSAGTIYVIMDVLDTTGRVIARLDRNGYVIGSRLAIRRPSKSNLVVLDENGIEALNIHYLNPSALSIDGYLHIFGRTTYFNSPKENPFCWEGSSPGGPDILLLKKEAEPGK